MEGYAVDEGEMGSCDLGTLIWRHNLQVRSREVSEEETKQQTT